MAADDGEHTDYLSYLLRLWRVDEASGGRGCAVWRASLESTHTGERKGFADLEELCGFLRGRIGKLSGFLNTHTEGENEKQEK